MSEPTIIERLENLKWGARYAKNIDQQYEFDNVIKLLIEQSQKDRELLERFLKSLKGNPLTEFPLDMAKVVFDMRKHLESGDG